MAANANGIRVQNAMVVPPFQVLSGMVDLTLGPCCRGQASPPEHCLGALPTLNLNPRWPPLASGAWLRSYQEV